MPSARRFRRIEARESGRDGIARDRYPKRERARLRSCFPSEGSGRARSFFIGKGASGRSKVCAGTATLKRARSVSSPKSEPGAHHSAEDHMTEYREGLPARPPRIKRLPLDARGYPVPWFVAYVDGVPDFRIVDTPKIGVAWNKQRCWICGGQLGRYLAFAIGPMCAVNRVSSEPPSHLECAMY